jgi:hypothetical protein
LKETRTVVLILLLLVSLGSVFQNAFTHARLPSFFSPAYAQSAVWTDKSTYAVGETVTITMGYTQMMGVAYWLIVYKPDGSSFKLTFAQNSNSATTTADQAGDWRVELWSQVVAPNTTPTLQGTCTFTVTSGPCPQHIIYITVTTSKPVYNVGDTIVVLWDASQIPQGATAALTLQGPSGTYTFNLDYATLMSGSYTVGQAEQKDVGPWTASLSGSVQSGTCTTPFQGSTTFQVGGGTYQINLFSSLQGSSGDLGATIIFDGVSHITPDSVSVTPNTWHTVAVLPYTMPYVFVNWEISGPTQIKDPYAQTTQVYIDHPGYIKAWYKQGNPKQAALTCAVSPNPISLSGGTSGHVTYTLTESNGVGVSVNAEPWQFIYSDQSQGSSGTDTSQIRVVANGQTTWDRWPLLPQEVAQKAAANGWNSVVLRYTFNGEDDNGNSITTTCDLTINLPSTPSTVQVIVTSSPMGSGFVSVDGNQINTPLSYAWTVGDKHTLAANSPVSYGGITYVFQSWSATSIPGGLTPSNPYQYSVPTTSETVTANYQQQQQTTTPSTVQITITSSPFGDGFVQVDGTTITTPYTYAWAPSSQHQLTAISPADLQGDRFIFSSWSNGVSQMSQTYTTPTTSETVTATFQLTQYYLTMNAGAGGTVTPQSGWYDVGAKLTISATASPGYSFTGWTGSGDGSYTGSNPSPTITMFSATTETAGFQPTTTQQYTLTMYAGAGGTVSPQSGTYNVGATVTISATASPGYTFSSWSGSGPGSYTGTANPCNNCVIINGDITETGNFQATPSIDNAQITSVQWPSGQHSPGDNIATTVTIQNTGTSTRSFWVGLSYQKPDGTWYDVPPSQTSTLSPSQTQTLTVGGSWTLPNDAPAGSYGAKTAIWNDYDSSQNVMKPPMFDSKTQSNAFTVQQTPPPIPPPTQWTQESVSVPLGGFQSPSPMNIGDTAHYDITFKDQTTGDTQAEVHLTITRNSASFLDWGTTTITVASYWGANDPCVASGSNVNLGYQDVWWGIDGKDGDKSFSITILELTTGELALNKPSPPAPQYGTTVTFTSSTPFFWGGNLADVCSHNIRGSQALSLEPSYATITSTTPLLNESWRKLSTIKTRT